MGVVRFALKFPHTFYVLAGLMLFLGISAILVTPKDIFPAINIPVVTVIWQYTGLTPEEMEQRVTTYSGVRSVRTSATSATSKVNPVEIWSKIFSAQRRHRSAIAQIVR
jgi:Cu/Ag efflux pump CusA